MAVAKVEIFHKKQLKPFASNNPIRKDYLQLKLMGSFHVTALSN